MPLIVNQAKTIDGTLPTTMVKKTIMGKKNIYLFLSHLKILSI